MSPGAGEAPGSNVMTYVALALAVGFLVLSMVMCGMTAMLRQYREFTVPLTLLLGLGTLVLGGFAASRLLRKR
ncbi:MAG TPA: hypothetical protein VFO85_00230 [Vicinamibacteria bacterium]|nr:hypothetical protein [Vicinamibacteria bacterium]